MSIRNCAQRTVPLNPQKYWYTLPFDDLVDDNTHLEAVVLFRFRDGPDGRPTPNNYVVTAYLVTRW